MIEKPDEIISQEESHESHQSHQPDDDGFVGVKRRRKRYRKFFQSGIADNVKESQIYSYLYKKNISPSHVSVFQSRRIGTLSAKIQIPVTSCTSVLEEHLWPKFVICKPWQTKERQTLLSTKNGTHLGNYSTYVPWLKFQSESLRFACLGQNEEDDMQRI